jgi:hypothetical protein
MSTDRLDTIESIGLDSLTDQVSAAAAAAVRLPVELRVEERVSLSDSLNQFE